MHNQNITNYYTAVIVRTYKERNLATHTSTSTISYDGVLVNKRDAKAI